MGDFIIILNCIQGLQLKCFDEVRGYCEFCQISHKLYLNWALPVAFQESETYWLTNKKHVMQISFLFGFGCTF